MPQTPLAWRNLTHDRVRFALFVAGVAFAVVLMLVQLGFRGALLDSQTLLHERLNADLVLVSPDRLALAMRETFPRRRLAQVAAVPGVATVSPLFVDNGAGVLRDADSDPAARRPGRSIRVIGVNPLDRQLTFPELDSTNPNSLAGKLRLPDTALFDRRSQLDPDRPGVSVFGPLSADRVTELNGRRVSLVGSVALGSDFTTDGTLIVSTETFADILRRPYTLGEPLANVDLGLVRLAPGHDPAAVQEAIRVTLADGAGTPQVDTTILTIPELVAREHQFWLTNTPIGFAFGFGMIMGFAVGLVICYQILSGDVADHLAEYATLKAVGYSNRFLALVILHEALILAVAGYGVGVAASLGLYKLLAAATGMPLTMSFERLGLVFAATVLMCGLSGLTALAKLVRADPADVFG